MTEDPLDSVLDNGGPGNLSRLRDGSLVVRERYNERYSRNGDAPKTRGGDLRTEGERDRGRLAYSSALRRLAGVTQVVSPELTASRMHSRESHTHKVALVARELAEHVVRLAESGHEGAIEVIELSGGLDIAACEAAGLAHDLGHAPFGHAGERALHTELHIGPDGEERLPDGFEGNPQSFRIITRLAGETRARQSMGLTNVTLCAVLKYPWVQNDAPALRKKREQAESDPPTDDVTGQEDAAARKARIAKAQSAKPLKFGAYKSDYPAFQAAREGVMGEGWETNWRQSLEAAIMDLADDVAYAAHDLEDFVLAEMIDLHDVVAELEDIIDTFSESLPADLGSIKNRNPFLKAAQRIQDDDRFDAKQYYWALGAVKKMIAEVLRRSNEHSRPTVLRSVLSDRIGQFFAELEVDAHPEPADAPYVRLSASHWHEIQVLKTIPRHWLISSPRMGVIQRAQTETIKALVNSIIGWLEQPDLDTAALPEGLRQSLIRAEVNLTESLSTLSAPHFRAIADYICGMSDSEALLRANWFTGREIPGMTMVVESA